MQIVHGDGPSDAKIVLVGEAPDNDTADRLLRSLLSGAGIDYDACYSTNIIKIQPTGRSGNIKRYFPTPKKPTHEAQGYIDLLFQEIRALDCPHVIVPVGAIALACLTDYAGINQCRGKVIAGKLGKTIPILHPAGIMKGNWSDTHITGFDLKKVKQESVSPAMMQRERTLLIDPDIMTVLETLERFKSSEYLTIDFETEQVSTSPKRYGPTPTRIGFADSADFAITIPFEKADRSTKYSPAEIHEIWNRVEWLVENKKMIAHNAMFEGYVFAHKFGLAPNWWMDTMIAWKTLFPEWKKSLEFVSSVVTNEGPYKKGIDTNAVMNAKDCAITHEAAMVIKAWLAADPDRERTYNFSMQLLEPLLYMVLRGVKCDMMYRADVRIKLQAEITDLEYKFQSMAGKEVSISSPTQMKKFFYTTLGAKKYVKRSTGKVSVDEDALISLAKQGYKAITDVVLGHRKKSKLMSTYVDMELSPKNRFHCTYNIAGTETGRLSSSALFAIGGNLHTIPTSNKKDNQYRIRDFFVSDFGHTMIEIDEEQAEARIVAAIAEEPFMLQAFADGKDIHAEMASIIFDKPVGGITKDERYTAKRLVHAFNYGTGVRRMRDAFLQDGHDVTEKQIRFVFDRINKVFPNIARWKEITRAKLRSTRELRTPFGRKSLFLDKYDDPLFRQAYAFIPQATIADHLNMVLVNCYNDPSLNWIDWLMQVHDAIVFQVPDARIAEAIEKVTPHFALPIMINGKEMIIPCEVKTGKSWGRLEKWNL